MFEVIRKVLPHCESMKSIRPAPTDTLFLLVLFRRSRNWLHVDEPGQPPESVREDSWARRSRAFRDPTVKLFQASDLAPPSTRRSAVAFRGPTREARILGPHLDLLFGTRRFGTRAPDDALSDRDAIRSFENMKCRTC